MRTIRTCNSRRLHNKVDSQSFNISRDSIQRENATTIFAPIVSQLPAVVVGRYLKTPLTTKPVITCNVHGKEHSRSQSLGKKNLNNFGSVLCNIQAGGKFQRKCGAKEFIVHRK